jgi:HPt (histidine-containing phosphotransfer) domain-containing protein
MKDLNISDLIQIFKEDLPLKIRRVHEPFVSGDLENTRRLAHQLRGAAGVYGFKDVVKLCVKIEESSTEDEIGAAFKELFETYPPTA